MARSSGRAVNASPRTSDPAIGVPPGEFTHARSGIHFSIWGDQFTFSRGELSGSRRFAFFIGSGAAARSFVWRKDSFLFEAPVTWYAAPQKWDVSPGYEHTETLRLARPIEPECLNCHASFLLPVAGTKNGFEAAPFQEGGIACERCHGPGRNHASIVNPAKLPAMQRDSVCAQCHLTGIERVERADRSLAAFRAGDDLTAFAVSFVRAGVDAVHVTSHFERLWQSRCKRVSGDRLWCGTCHNPHAASPASYTEKCLGCHSGSEHATANRGGCIACHMPRIEAADAPYTAFTDHSMPRKPGAPRYAAPGELRPFWGSGGDRELGLAYARLAYREKLPGDFERAFELLLRANADDAPSLTQLANLYDHFGDEGRANELYRRSYAKDPSQAEVAVNVGAIYAKEESVDDAIRVWREALLRYPGLEEARVKLALGLLATGEIAQARETLLEFMDYNPDSPFVRKLLAGLRDAPR
jgi:hypothetical protein